MKGYPMVAHEVELRTWNLGEPPKWHHWAGFALIAMAEWLMFLE